MSKPATWARNNSEGVVDFILSDTCKLLQERSLCPQACGRDGQHCVVFYSLCRVTDQGIMCTHHLPGTREMETSQDSAEKPCLCQCPPRLGPRLHVCVTGAPVRSPDGLRSLLTLATFSSVLIEQTARQRQSKQKPVPGTALDFARQECTHCDSAKERQ